jgi:hypothetical protein
MRRLIVMTLVGLLFVGAAGCGGDKKSSDDDVSAATTTTEDSGGSDKADDAGKSDASSSDSSNNSGISAAAFTKSDCTEAIQAVSAAYSVAGLAMSGQTDQIDKTQKEFDAFAKKAPSAIRDDIQTVQDAYGEFGRVISESGWKPSDGAPPKEVLDKIEAASNKLDSDEVKTANTNIESWLHDQCGDS